MLAVLVNNALAIPSSYKNTLAAKTDSLIVSNGGPCVVNRETNCVCSSNFNVDKCDNTATGPFGTVTTRLQRGSRVVALPGGYANNEDCDIEWSETVELAVPFFDTEPDFDRLTVDHHCSNKAMDTTAYSGDGYDIDGSKACNMHWRSDGSKAGMGFKVCGISLWTNPGGKPPKGGSFPGGTVPPDTQACPCGTNAQGDQPAGHAPGGGDAAGDNCFTNPKWPCPRLSMKTSSASGTKLKTKETSWAEDVDAILSRNNVKASIGCCVCKGGWMAGYDPTGDGATETDLGEMTRPECILAAKAAGGNAASIDDSATDTVTGTCFSETNAHFSPAGWVDDSTRQACLFGL